MEVLPPLASKNEKEVVRPLTGAGPFKTMPTTDEPKPLPEQPAINLAALGEQLWAHAELQQAVALKFSQDLIAANQVLIRQMDSLGKVSAEDMAKKVAGNPQVQKVLNPFADQPGAVAPASPVPG